MSYCAGRICHLFAGVCTAQQLWKGNECFHSIYFCRLASVFNTTQSFCRISIPIMEMGQIFALTLARAPHLHTTIGMSLFKIELRTVRVDHFNPSLSQILQWTRSKWLQPPAAIYWCKAVQHFWKMGVFSSRYSFYCFCFCNFITLHFQINKLKILQILTKF